MLAVPAFLINQVPDAFFLSSSLIKLLSLFFRSRLPHPREEEKMLINYATFNLDFFTKRGEKLFDTFHDEDFPALEKKFIAQKFQAFFILLSQKSRHHN